MPKVDLKKPVWAKTIRKAAQVFLKAISAYPHKEISEYTRLIDQIDEFLRYGCWDDYDDA